MVKKIERGTIIILDVGKNVSDPEEKHEKSFFEKTRKCAARIIERKILSQGKDYLGVILLGSKKTMNNMAEQCEGAFRNIELFYHLQPPTWKIIRDLPQTPSKRSGDWVEALAVAADHVKNEVSGVSIMNLKLILMTNFQTPTRSTKSIQMVLDGLKIEKFEVDIIGPDIYDNNNKSSDLELARDFVQQTNGTTATFDETMSYLRFHKKKSVRPQPWNVDLSIGPYIKIPVTSYIRIQYQEDVDKSITRVKDPITSKPSITEYVANDKVLYNTENQSKVDISDTTKGYEFGHQYIPSSDTDKLVAYKPGDKSLSLYGFTLASNVQWQYLDSQGLSYMFGRKGDKKAQQTITCLTEILHEKKLVGIARKVTNNNNAPKMFVLMPVIDTNNYMCLSMVSLCYKEAIKYMSFPPTNIRKYSCTKNQVDTFIDLIKAMDLTKAYDDSFDDAEAFPTGETISPAAQHTLDCIAYRAMNPDKPLPKPRDDIMNLFKVPSLVENCACEPLERINKLFLLQKVEEKPSKRRTKKLINVGTSDQTCTSVHPNNDNIAGLKIELRSVDDSNEKSVISTINPVRDFTTLISKGYTLADLAPEMTEVIESLLYYNLDGTYTKATITMTHLRNQCIKTDPSIYNKWLQKFKVDLTNRNRDDIYSLIKAKEVDFILKSENSLSTFETIDSHAESQLYEMDTVPESTEMVINPEINDLFDEM